MNKTKQIKISEIVEGVQKNVTGVTSVVKQPGTNSYFIRISNTDNLDETFKQIESCGFDVSPKGNKKERVEQTKCIYAEFDHVIFTIYNRQVKHYNQRR